MQILFWTLCFSGPNARKELACFKGITTNQWYLIRILCLLCKQDTAGKYRELAAKKCHHVPKPTVELQRSCTLAECPVRTTPGVHRWSKYHHVYPQPQPQPPPQPPSAAEWHSSPWSQVCWAGQPLCSSGWKMFNVVTNTEGRLATVHSDVWRGSAGQDGSVSGQGNALCWLRLSSQAISVTGLQHQLLPTAGEER